MGLKASRSLLGIELHEQEIRIVEIRNKDGEASISALAVFKPGEDFLGEWGVTDPERLGAQLRHCLDEANIHTSEAAFGIPAWCCLVRPLGVPPVAGQELHRIVEGEIEHYQLFREPGASFDLVRLNDSKLLESSFRNFLMFGAERRILESVQVLARAAGLRLIAVEPTHSALYRVAYSQVTSPPSVVVTLSETHAQISLLDAGQLALHRSFDLGSSIFDVPDPEDGTFKPYFDVDAASSLAIELRRSIDFLARELPESRGTDLIHMGCTHAEASTLAHWLESALQLTVQVSDIRRGGPNIRILKALTEKDTNRYVAAYGLALRDPRHLPEGVPIISLFANQRVKAEVKEEGRRKFGVAMVCSLVLLACGLLTAALGTVRARSAANDLAKSKEKLATTQQIEQAQAQQAIQKEERLRLLSAEGVPVRSLISAITRAVPDGVGLMEVRMSPATADISGETTSQAAIIKMSDSLRSEPLFAGVSLTWFESVDPNIPAAGIRFRMSVQNAPRPVAPPPSASPTTTASLGLAGTPTGATPLSNPGQGARS
ncbi:PilN domain-containing protein [Fimbriimonas ginsengisoli]|uniref:Type IV pilus assembly protein PilM n=1 Tax=Fimbriimonas ginsengisoli Gsoil 348 TaxID=661478 RepID=A0A068NKP7_FIMGI|nr:PilN domain-containing protein [Fimbriimonas ginsengisoli]AIE84007.1 type IV pilus assembly protein PilM [Fimbriimonas ginsengisoli Gsoil 348]